MKRNAAVSESEFWSWVERIGWGTRTTDVDAIKRALMTQWTVKYAEAFQAMLQKVEARLYNVLDEWSKDGHWENENRDFGLGDDGFGDLISHIIGLGKREYDAVVKDPRLALTRAHRHLYKEKFSYGIPSKYDWKDLSLSKFQKWGRKLLKEYAGILQDKDLKQFHRGAQRMVKLVSPIISGDIAGFLANEDEAKKLSENMEKTYQKWRKSLLRRHERIIWQGGNALENKWVVWNLYSDVRESMGPGPIMRIGRLQRAVVRLAHERSDLRSHLVPLLKRTGAVRQWDDEEDKPKKKVPAGPWTSTQVKEIFANQWDYGFFFRGKGSPWSSKKEEAAIVNHLQKSHGDGPKFVQRVLQSVNRIKDPMAARRMADACGTLAKNPNWASQLYDREGYCYGDTCVLYAKYAKKALMEVQQVYWWKALTLAGATYLKRPSLSISPPPKKKEVKWAPPAIPSGMVPTTVDGWQLYNQAGASRAAKALGKSLSVALLSLGRNVTPHKTMKANVAAASKIRARMEKVLNTYGRFGAADTEGLVTVNITMRQYLETYLEKWKHQEVFDAVTR